MTDLKPQVLRRSFTDFDELTEAAQGWNLELCKLDRGPFFGEIFQLITPDFIIGRGNFNSRLKQSGEPPAGFRTLAIPAVASHNMLWRSRPVTGNDLLIFPAGAELHAFSESDFNIFTLSIAEHLLEKFIPLRRLQGVEVLPLNPDTLAELRKRLHQIERGVENVGPALEILLHQLAQAIVEARPNSSAQVPNSRRIQAILNAERLILSNPSDPLSVQALCTATGVSKRTLEYAFNEYAGVAPKTYLNALRLNAVHKQLRGARSGQTRVVEVANTWGFWHMGQFAADYRKLFGQNPSITLGCNAKPCKSTCPFRGQCKLCRET